MWGTYYQVDFPKRPSGAIDVKWLATCPVHSGRKKQEPNSEANNQEFPNLCYVLPSGIADLPTS